MGSVGLLLIKAAFIFMMVVLNSFNTAYSQGSCVSGNAIECCTLNLASCFQSFCFCDRVCFSLGDCCPDVFATCHPAVQIGITASSFTIEEGESSAFLTVQSTVVQDISQNLSFFSPPLFLNTSFLISSSDGTAEAPGDYTELNQVVLVTRTGNLSIPISIVDDFLPEVNEFFNVSISSINNVVSIGPLGTAQIFILDNGMQQESFGLLLSPVIINVTENRPCPSNDVREAAIRSIHDVVSLLKLVPGCGSGFWFQVADLDFSDVSQQCPTSSWNITTSPARSCVPVTPASCPGVMFPTRGVRYSRVCGRATGYGLQDLDAFLVQQPANSTDDLYLDGVSVTHGFPRQHIWSFAVSSGAQSECPCNNPNQGQVPSFIANKYFCEFENSGSAVWDNVNCTSANCCTFNDPPWFSVSLPASTTEDLEVRICSDEDSSSERVQLSQIQLFVQ